VLEFGCAARITIGTDGTTLNGLILQSGVLRLVLWIYLEKVCGLKPDGSAKELTEVSEMKQYPRPKRCTRNTQACHFINTTAALLYTSPAAATSLTPLRHFFTLHLLSGSLLGSSARILRDAVQEIFEKIFYQ
jgi:hypothetical protein